MAKLNALQVKNLVEPGRYSDGEGLILKIGPTGGKSWILRVQVNGCRRDIGLDEMQSAKLRAVQICRLPTTPRLSDLIAMLPEGLRLLRGQCHGEKSLPRNLHAMPPDSRFHQRQGDSPSACWPLKCAIDGVSTWAQT
jgi:hypothetical protein